MQVLFFQYRIRSGYVPGIKYWVTVTQWRLCKSKVAVSLISKQAWICEYLNLRSYTVWIPNKLKYSMQSDNFTEKHRVSGFISDNNLQTR